MSWSAQQYVTFEDERTRPVRDLLAAVPTDPVRAAVDIGCGPGNSTQCLIERFPDAAVRGLDRSPDMIRAARERLPGVRFEIAGIKEWADLGADLGADPGADPGAHRGPFDLILANAALQWVPDHATLLPSLVAKLAPGGSLAVQMPDNLEEPAHRLMRGIAADGPWADKLAGASAARTARADAGWYYGLLRPRCVRVDIWLTVYHHPLAGGARAVVEWFKGSGLRPYLDPLDAGERAAYLARYEAEVARAYPALPDGSVLLPFPRLFIVATR